MNKKYTIKAELREALGTSNSRRLRRAGFVPAVVYGQSKEAQPLSISADDALALHHHTGLATLDLSDGTTKGVIVKDIEINPISQLIMHIDFKEIVLGEPVEATVPVETHGTPAGAVQGGKLETITHELQIRGLPSILPDAIHVDVSSLAFDEVWRAKDITLPEGITIASAEDSIIVQCKLHGKREEDEEQTDEEEVAE